MLIEPAQLESAAVVPQCLDAQFVTDDALAEIVSRHGRKDESGLPVDFLHPRVKSLRERATKLEFVRSLVYSPQVVVNSAFFWNNPLVFDLFSRDGADPAESFVRLMGDHAIVPFIRNGTSLGDESVGFARHDGGADAVCHLLDRLDAHGLRPKYLRLSRDDAENERLRGDLAVAFGNYFQGLLNFDVARRSEMAGELFADPEIVQNEGVFDRFNDELDRLADVAYAFAKERRSRERAARAAANAPAPKPATLDRKDLYELLLGVTGDDQTNGRFRDTGVPLPVLTAVKKLIDLRYNTALPDKLDRYTFTPLNMPSRTALQDEQKAGDPLGRLEGLVEEARRLCRAFTADAQRSMTLPALEDLTLADVVTIRSFPEWENFRDFQREFLADPLSQAGRIGEFNDAFDALQARIASWYRETHRAERLGRYETFVTFAVGIGHLAFKFGLDGSDLIDRVIELPEAFGIAHLTRGLSAKLVFNVVDTAAGLIDRRRSWQLQIARSNEEFQRGYFLDCLKRVRETLGASLPHVSQLADQGRE